jgi:hypothetical protein
MSKERWFECYERAYNEAPEGTPEDVLAKQADEMLAEQEAFLVDQALDELWAERTYA